MSAYYVNDILRPGALPYLQQLPGVIFQQDNATLYMAATTRTFFRYNNIHFCHGRLHFRIFVTHRKCLGHAQTTDDRCSSTTVCQHLLMNFRHRPIQPGWLFHRTTLAQKHRFHASVRTTGDTSQRRPYSLLIISTFLVHATPRC